MSKVRRSIWFDVLGKSATFLTLIFGAILATIHARFLYQVCLKVLDFPERVNLSGAKILANYDVLMRYMNQPFQKELVLPDFPSSVQGLKHFSEVKVLFLVATVLFVLFLLPAIYYLNQLRKEKRFWTFILPVKMFLLSILGLFAVSLVGFEQFFITFHEILFRNDDWLYDPALDPVITILPEEYFMLCFSFFFLLVLLGLSVLFLLGRRSLKQKV